jgi:hypothetical protein
VMFAAQAGQRHDTKWFYERSRGQFINARGKLSAAQQKKFDLEYPKTQLFSKTDLAKFEFSAAGLPHVVSRGAQKNFAEFAKLIGEAWTKSDEGYDELWYKRLISKALIFRWLETEVPKQTWYEGGYRANIVTYAMAKVFHDSEREKQVLDLDVIWRRQFLPDPLQRALLVAAAEAHVVVTHPPAGVRNMSEWAKQQGCWHSMKSRALSYGVDFDSCLTLVDTARTAKRDEKTRKIMTAGINAQAEVVNLGAEYWKKVLMWGREYGGLSLKDSQILEVCASLPRRIPSELQARHAMATLARMQEQGFSER